MIRCFAITVPNLPLPKIQPEEARNVTEFLETMRGLLGIYINYPNGTILLFDTLANAKIGRGRFEDQGNACGDYIMNAELSDDKQEVEIKKAVEGRNGLIQ